MGNPFIFDAAINDEIFTADDMRSKPQNNIYINEFEQVTAESLRSKNPFKVDRRRCQSIAEEIFYKVWPPSIPRISRQFDEK